MADAHVRPARPDDASAIGTVQAGAWREAYATLVPTDVLDTFDGPLLARSWREAIVAPPSARARVLVALGGPRVVGFAAAAPGTDPDLDPSSDAEVAALVVDPTTRRAGHGSRLLAATVAELQSAGFERAYVWLTDSDVALRHFLADGGWAEDGARRSLDLYGDAAIVVPQLRLHTDIGE